MRSIVYLLSLLLFLSCSQNSESSLSVLSFEGIKGRVADAETGKILSARIVIRDEAGNVLNSYYSHLPGFFTQEDGSFEQKLDTGSYTLTVYHGIDYESQEMDVEINPEQGVEANIFLKPWQPLKEEGWVSGGGHCHLYTDNDKDTAMLTKVRKICLAQGIDFMCASQGWAGYTDSTWREGYADFTDDRFFMHYGSEMPKYRTGHTWWIGQESTRGYYGNSMDENYEQKYYQADTGTAWSYADINFPNIPNPDVVQGIKRAENAVAIMAHPTSWWWQDRGEISKYTTNVVSYLSFGLLAGKIWDGFVVMGYNHDHYAYQNLWFHILNQGFRMPAISELDGGLGPKDRFYYGSMRTYYKVDGDFSVANVADAVRRGETFVTSGPILKLNVDGQYKMGEIVRIDKKQHTLNIEAKASGDQEDYLSYIVVYRNGEIEKLWDIRQEKLRTFSTSLSILEEEKAWYVVKAYGKKAWENPEHLDIFKISDKSLHIETPPYHGDIHDVCISSPFYFWPEGTVDPEALQSGVNLSLLSPEGGEEIKDGSIDILVNGSLLKTVELVGGHAKFDMPVHGVLKITIGDQSIHRGLFLDYIPHRDVLEELASGRWMSKLPEGISYAQGEVPWDAFRYEETKAMLSNVKWEIEFSENERDHLWQDFEDRF